MAGHLCLLATITICLVSHVSAANSSVCHLDNFFSSLQSLSTLHGSMETLIAKMEDLKQTVNMVMQDQEDVKKHLLKRLEAIEEKTEWCLEGRQRKIEKPTTLEEKPLENYRDCQDVYNEGFTKSGIYWISPNGSTRIQVFCEQELDGGGWTVFQRRQDGSINFYRTWNDYKTGFGNLTAEFWLGNDNLHLLTKNQDQKLKIELKGPDGEIMYAHYSAFWIDGENLKYKLHVTGYSGGRKPGDSFTYHHESSFSTKDRDNDRYSGHCARDRSGAWWYKSCDFSNLNGVYGGADYTGIKWSTWKGNTVSMKGTQMMIKKKT